MAEQVEATGWWNGGHVPAGLELHPSGQRRGAVWRAMRWDNRSGYAVAHSSLEGVALL